MAVLPPQVIKDSGTLWESGAYTKAPASVRVRLKRMSEPAMLVDASPPYQIVATNQAWQEQCGFGKEVM